MTTGELIKALQPFVDDTEVTLSIGFEELVIAATDYLPSRSEAPARVTILSGIRRPE